MADESVMGIVAQRLVDYGSLAQRVSTTAELVGAVTAVGQLLLDTYRRGGRLLAFGNGGSAADAQHLAAELVGRCTTEREPLPALALADNIATVTALANDYGYDEVFARQVRAHARSGDVVLALSTSGRSPNVLRGLEEARVLGLTTVALTGADGGAMVADHVLRVPATHSGRVQEVHMMWCHVWVEAVERSLAADG